MALISDRYLHVCILCICTIDCIIKNVLAEANNTCIPEGNPPYEWTDEAYPDPQLDIGRCGRDCKKSWVCDPNRIISPSRADYLDEKLDTLRRSGHCSCRSCESPISIALLSKIQINGDGKASDSTARAFAQRIRYKWDVNKCNDDLLILLSRDDRKIFTSIGNNIENIISYDCAEEIYLSVRPLLSKGLYYTAFLEMIDKYRQVFETEDCAAVIRSTDSGSSSGLAVWEIVLAVIGSIVGAILCCLCCYCCCKGGGCKGGSGGSSYHSSGGGYFGGSYFDGGGGGGGGGSCDGGGGGDGGGDF